MTHHPYRYQLSSDHKKVVDYIRVRYRNQLTMRECECYYCIIRGMSVKRIALVLDISFRTVEKFIASLKIKMKCLCKNDLIEIAFRDGIVVVSPDVRAYKTIH